MLAARRIEKTMRILAILACAIPFAFGCGGSTSTSSDGVSTVIPAEITLEANPNPIAAQPSPNPDYQWAASFNLTIRESAGIGGEINEIFAQLDESTGGIVVSSGDVFYDYIVTATTNRVEGNGNATVDFDFVFEITGGSRESLITVLVVFVDDNQFTTEASIRIPVN